MKKKKKSKIKNKKIEDSKSNYIRISRMIAKIVLLCFLFLLLLLLPLIIYRHLHSEKYDIPKITVVSYAAGDEIHYINQVDLDKTLPKNYKHVMYNEKMIKTFIDSNPDVFKHKRGSGYWLWKPYIILKELEKMNEDERLLYIDSGSHLKNPIDDLIKEYDEDLISFECLGGQKLKQWTKRDLFIRMNLDNPDIVNSLQAEAGFLILKKSAIPIIQEWLRLGSIPENIDDSPSKIENYPEFEEHRHDQSILSLLIMTSNKYGVTTKVLPFEEKYPKYVNHHRRRNL